MIRLDLQQPQDIKAFQLTEIKKLLKNLNENSAFYKDHFEKNGINVSDINSLEDFSKIPSVGKDDLQQRNWDFLCVPKEDIIEYCSTSGTMGKPVTIALTEKDLQRLGKNELFSLESIGASKQDVIQFMLTLDRQFMAGIAYYLGARQLGCGAVRVGPGNIAMQVSNILELKSTILVAVPSFILSLKDYAAEHGIDMNKTAVRKILCIGENIKNEDLSLNSLGKRITENWGVELFSTYASTEKQTAFTDCLEKKGAHNQPDLLYFEILDDNGSPVKAGVSGELVITTLGVEGMPLLRYRTGDICFFIDEPCKCGHNSMRISPVLGRKQQMIKLNGTSLFPQTIFNVLDKMEEIEGYVVKVYKSSIETDDLHIDISLKRGEDILKNKVKQSLQSALKVTPVINYLPHAEIQKLLIPDGKRKASKLVDYR